MRTSNAAGIFNFNALPPDTGFTLTVEKNGFQKQVIDKVQVISGPVECGQRAVGS